MARKHSSAKSQPSGEAKGVVIAQVLKEVQLALQNAQTRTVGAGFPKFQAATVTLQTVIVKSAGGKFKFLVFSFGRAWEKELSHEMVLKLSVPSIAPIALAPPTLASELANAIVETATGVKEAQTANPPLSLDEFKVGLQFAVTEDTSGGAEFSILPISFELKGGLKNKAIHKIELNFKR